MRQLANRPVSQGGFMLLEALIAILIFSVGVLSMVGLQSMATRYSTDAKFRSTAGYLASQRMSQIWLADHNVGTFATDWSESDTTLADLPSGKRTVSVAGNALNGYLVTVTINWTMPGDSTVHQHLAVTRIHDRCDAAATC